MPVSPSDVAPQYQVLQLVVTLTGTRYMVIGGGVERHGAVDPVAVA